MLILAECSYIIRLDAADERFPGGREALIQSQKSLVGRSVFFDDDLIIFHSLRGMSDIRSWDNEFESKGLRLTEMIQGVRVAGDRCYTSYQTGWGEPCDWIGINQWDNTVWFWKEDFWKGSLRLRYDDLVTLNPPPEKVIHES